MPTDDDVANPRRMRIRRNGRGFAGGGSGNSTRSESLRTSAERDEVDDAIDPDTMDDRVRQAPPRRLPGSVSDPARRLQETNMAGSARFAKEYRLQLLHRMLIRNLPLDQIARQLNVSISTVEKDRAELKKMLRERAKELDINELIGNQTALYEDVAGMALRIASDSGTQNPDGSIRGGQPTAMRLAAMRTSLAAKADQTRFYQSAGVFDVLKFRRTEDGAALSDIGMLMAQTRELIAGLQDDTDDGFSFDDRADFNDDLDGEVINV